jgi:hypothetical protein
MLRANPDCIFVFGDNSARKGLGGQAKEMRGEPNALGIATKRLPAMTPEAFFSDDSTQDVTTLAGDLAKLIGFHTRGFQIYAPLNGIGTDRARLKENAPLLYKLIIETFEPMSGPDYPWK